MPEAHEPLRSLPLRVTYRTLVLHLFLKVSVIKLWNYRTDSCTMFQPRLKMRLGYSLFSSILVQKV